jgi:hypothetical protein
VLKMPWQRRGPVQAAPAKACNHPSFVVRDDDRIGWCTCTSCGAPLALADALNGLRDRLVAAIDRANRRGRRR